jgi:hypothetical protein
MDYSKVLLDLLPISICYFYGEPMKNALSIKSVRQARGIRHESIPSWIIIIEEPSISSIIRWKSG